MSGFGVKTPLRKAIIVNDFFYESAGELTTFLLEKFNGDNNKYYKEFDSKTLNDSRNSCTSTLKILYCRKSQMISFFPDGSYRRRQIMCACEKCKLGLFDTAVEEMKVVLETEHENISEEVCDFDLEINDLDNNVAYAATEPNTYIAIYSTENSLEFFYIVSVEKKELLLNIKVTSLDTSQEKVRNT